MSENKSQIWNNPIDQPQLDGSQVHLWRSSLDLPITIIKQLANILSEDEIAKADRFRFPQHRRRYIAARGILRQLLGKYLQISPNNIKFKYGDRGKPSLTKSISSSSLEFNISHSQDYALYGFAYNHPIGVDIENLRTMQDAAQIAQRFFSPQEFELVNCLSGEQQQRVFFKLWTAKEAYLKAIGTGLAGSLASIDITFDNSEIPYLKSIQGDTTAIVPWSMYPCIPALGYVGAIAIKTKITPQQIKYLNWQF